MEYYNSLVAKKAANHTTNDAIRLVYILLQPHHRTNLDYFLKGVSNQTDFDQAVSTKMSWFSGIPDGFNGKEILVTAPSILKNEDTINVNPNDFETIGTTQDAKW